MTTTTWNTVAGVFSGFDPARRAVSDLKAAGFAEDSISLIAPSTSAGVESKSHVKSDAEVGAAVGGIGGLLASFAAATVPGVGPVLMAGQLIAAMGGVAVGALAGGLVGAMTRIGVPEEDARTYAESVRRGDVVVTVRAVDRDVERARSIMDAAGAIDVEDRVSNWRQRGWVGHDPGVEPMSADELRREREYYAASEEQAYEWEHMNEKERKHTGHEDAGTNWPHRKPYDLGQSLVEAEAENASVDQARTEDAAEKMWGKDRKDLEEEVGATGTYENVGAETSEKLRDLKNSNREFGASIENNRRVTDPITQKIESGAERAKESAVRSAKRRARVYSHK